MGKASAGEVTDDQDDDLAVIEDGEEGEQLEEEQQADEADSDAAGESDGEGAIDEVSVTIGDEQPADEEDEKRAPEWVREVRQRSREKDRRIRELENQLAQAKPAQQAVVVGDKPTLEGCEYDAEKFERELEAWHTRKRESEEQTRTRTESEQKQRAQWQTRIDAVGKAASELKVKDYEDASQAFEDTFSVMQQGIVIGGPDDVKTSALLRYALGKNPKIAKQIAAITDPVKFAFAVAKLETQLKVTTRKSAPPPDRQVRSTVAGAAVVDKTLDRLRAEADKTGDYTKVIAHKNALRSKQRT